MKTLSVKHITPTPGYVLVEPAKQDKTIINIGPETQDAIRGEGGAIFPITLENQGSASKSFTISVSGAQEFAIVKISPSNLVVVDGGETKSVNVFLAAQENAEIGPHPFNLEIKSGEKMLEQVPLTLNVVQPKAKGLSMNGIEIKLLLVLLIILVVVAAIIGYVLYSKDHESNEPLAESVVEQKPEEPKESVSAQTQTYY